MVLIRFNDTVHKVKWLGDTVDNSAQKWGYRLWLIGNTFGATHLIGAKSLQEAVEYYQDDIAVDQNDEEHCNPDTDTGLDYGFEYAPNGGVAYMGDTFVARYDSDSKKFDYVGMLG